MRIRSNVPPSGWSAVPRREDPTRNYGKTLAGTVPAAGGALPLMRHLIVVQGTNTMFVLVHVHAAGASAAQHADDPKQGVLDPHLLADGRFRIEKPLSHGFADDPHRAAAAEFLVAEHCAGSQVFPVADRNERGRGAVDAGGHPIAMAVNKWALACITGATSFDGRALAANLFRVPSGKGPRRRCRA